MWRNLITAPFTRASYLKNPGPGQYLQGKNKEDIKQRLLNEEKITVPFSSSETRQFFGKTSKTPVPGPGYYIDIFDLKNSSIIKKSQRG